jgi:hypothetical protein
MKIFVSTPCIDGKVDYRYIVSKSQMTSNHSVETYYLSQCSHITKARNDSFHMFMKSDADILLTIDSDIIVNPPYILDKVLNDMDPESIMGGFYSMKGYRPDGRPQINGVPLDETVEFKLDGSIIPMKYIATGFMLVPKKVAKMMILKYQDLEYINDSNEKSYNLYNTMVTDFNGVKRWLPEDFSFCQRARDIGIELYCHTGLVLSHIGEHIYDLKGYY